jgi:hypothetical protein
MVPPLYKTLLILDPFTRARLSSSIVEVMLSFREVQGGQPLQD